MTEIIRLSPHDPAPDGGKHGLVLRHMGEDDPNAVVTEIIFYGSSGSSTAAHHANGTAMSLDEAVQAARHEAEKRGVSTIYVLDRTAGKLEHQVLAHRGDHSFPAEKLEDTDPEDGERGADIRDRANNSGYMR